MMIAMVVTLVVLVFNMVRERRMDGAAFNYQPWGSVTSRTEYEMGLLLPQLIIRYYFDLVGTLLDLAQ